jgi:O-antigen ligase
LTGRGPLWQELLEDYVPQRALIGYGYGSFWSAEHIAELSKSQSWAIQSTHSSYIDLLLNVGLVGAVLCISAMVLACVRAWRLEVRERGAGYGFIALVIAYGLADGLSETTIGINWHLSLFGICAICYLVFNSNRDSRQRSSNFESTSRNSKLLLHRGQAIA